MILLHQHHFRTVLIHLHYPFRKMGYISPTKKARIMLLKRQDVPVTKIAKRYYIETSTVYCIAQKYTETKDFYYVKPKTGRPHKFTTKDIQYAARILARNHAHDVSDLQRQYFPTLHADMIQKRLMACGLKAYVCHRKPFLSGSHKTKHFAWAKAHKHWTAKDWKSVIFSDESKFNLFGSNRHCWCWRRPGEEFNERYVRKKVKYGGSSIMVWGCITALGIGCIVCIKDNMDSAFYTQILNDDVLGTLKDLGINKKDVYFQ